jgi:hypothetical protein
MNIKIFCRVACFLPGRAKDLSALLQESSTELPEKYILNSATEILLMRSVSNQMRSLHTIHCPSLFIKVFPFLPKFPELVLFHKFVITTYEYQWVTGVLSPEVKRPVMILTTHLQIGPKLRMIGCTACGGQGK